MNVAKSTRLTVMTLHQNLNFRCQIRRNQRPLSLLITLKLHFIPSIHYQVNIHSTCIFLPSVQIKVNWFRQDVDLIPSLQIIPGLFFLILIVASIEAVFQIPPSPNH